MIRPRSRSRSPGSSRARRGARSRDPPTRGAALSIEVVASASIAGAAGVGALVHVGSALPGLYPAGMHVVPSLHGRGRSGHVALDLRRRSGSRVDPCLPRRARPTRLDRHLLHARHDGATGPESRGRGGGRRPRDRRSRRRAPQHAAAFTLVGQSRHPAMPRHARRCWRGRTDVVPSPVRNVCTRRVLGSAQCRAHDRAVDQLGPRLAGHGDAGDRRPRGARVARSTAARSCSTTRIVSRIRDPGATRWVRCPCSPIRWPPAASRWDRCAITGCAVHPLSLPVSDTALAVGLALLGGACYATAAVLQQRVASEQPIELALSPRLDREVDPATAVAPRDLASTSRRTGSRRPRWVWDRSSWWARSS